MSVSFTISTSTVGATTLAGITATANNSATDTLSSTEHDSRGPWGEVSWLREPRFRCAGIKRE